MHNPSVRVADLLGIESGLALTRNRDVTSPVAVVSSEVPGAPVMHAGSTTLTSAPAGHLK